MWKKWSLRVRLYVIMTALVVITMTGALITIWYTYRIENLLTRIISKDLAAFQATEAMVTALINQKGLVSYYFMDGNPDWLRQLGEYRQIFKDRLRKVRNLAETERETDLINQIESEYIRYVTGKDQVIAYYRSGQKETGSTLHKKVRSYFFKALTVCEEYKGLHQQLIDQAKEKSHIEARKLRVSAGAAIFIVLLLSILLFFVSG